MKNPVLIIIFLLMAWVAKAQKENNIWYFGEFAGLDFNTQTPVPLVV